MTDFSVPTECKGYAALSPSEGLKPFTFQRRACGPKDVVIDILFAGICHSDIHQVREEWGKGIFPMVPGHEIVGKIAAVGSDVTKFKVGDAAGVGCMVDSCRSCKNCDLGNEQYCFQGMVGTYNGKHKYPHSPEPGCPTYGGYSKRIVVDQDFALLVPANLDLAGAAPLLCAGITVYSPMMKFGLKPSMKFGVVGLGGLGHMAAKFGVAMGCNTTVISRGNSKREGAMKDLKINNYIDSTNADEMKAAANTFDMLICTVSASYNISDYLSLLTFDGQYIVVGAPPEPLALGMFPLIMQRKSIAGSLIGGIKETQEMLDFCGEKNIICDIEMITADKIDESYERAIKGDVKYRFVIDTASI